MGSDKFCLRWNDFESNLSNAFKELRDHKDFFDVTLAFDDEQVQAHKVILSACSPFFYTILRRNPHQHPLLYMKGVKFSDLQAVLTFMYHGEVNVAQEELNSFLAVAEDLQVKGLTQTQSFPHSTSSPVDKTPRTTREKDPSLPLKQFQAPVHIVDNDIQEMVSIKSEPREPPALPNRNIPEAPLPVALDTTDDQGYEDYTEYQEQMYTEMDTTMNYSMVVETTGKGNTLGQISSPHHTCLCVSTYVMEKLQQGLLRN